MPVIAVVFDFDDTHLPSVLHPSASVIPAALAAGEAVQAKIEDVIAAAAAGYEICIRTGMAAYDRELGNSIFFEPRPRWARGSMAWAPRESATPSASPARWARA